MLDLPSVVGTPGKAFEVAISHYGLINSPPFKVRQMIDMHEIMANVCRDISVLLERFQPGLLPLMRIDA